MMAVREESVGEGCVRRGDDGVERLDFAVPTVAESSGNCSPGEAEGCTRFTASSVGGNRFEKGVQMGWEIGSGRRGGAGVLNLCMAVVV